MSIHRALKSTDLMPFGKFAGTPMIDVPAEYLLYIYDNGLQPGGVCSYIIDNEKYLRQEVEETRRKSHDLA